MGGMQYRKMNVLKRLSAMALLPGMIWGTPAQARELENPAEAFGRRTAVHDIALSPEGERVVFVGAAAGRGSNAYVASVAGGEARVIASTTGDPGNLRWCRFSGPSRIVCSISALSENYFNNIVGVSRLVAMGEEGENAVSLGRRRGSRYDGRIIDWLTEEDNIVLLSRFVRGGLRAVRLDTVTGDFNTSEMPNAVAGDFMTDGHGNIRIMMSRELRGATGMIGNDINIFFRERGDETWHNLSTYNDGDRTGFYPLAVDHDLDAAYGFERTDGRYALYRVALSQGDSREMLFSHDSVDVGSLITIGRQGWVIGVGYADDRPRVEYIDAEYRQLAEALSAALPDLPVIHFIDSNDDETRLLIWAGSDTDPGRYYVFDRNAGMLNHILDERPALQDVELAPVRSVRYPASDGTMIPGYLTLPPGREGERLPAIVMPHGGPEARDVWGFDWMAQFFAHQGYAVLQPNFRGSHGYGDGWLVENGFRNWETAIRDINDGARWLVSEGIAEAERMAGVGWSYGGYAVLQSAVYEPGLFKAVVAIAPVTDLPTLRREGMRYVGGRNLSEYLGSGPHVMAGSPARNADRIVAPVLLFHGDVDVNVDIQQSRIMQDRLEDADRPTELVTFEGLAHGLADSDARTQLLEQSDTFIREALGI